MDIQALQGGEPQFDRSQFKLQPDGTFKISIRGMAAMAGVDFSALARNLRTAVAENPLPCARSLVAQGFDPVAVTRWAETGGIPEDAVPFILEHYGNESRTPSKQARMVLLAFSRVGINAYLKDKLGVIAVQNKPATFAPQSELAAAIDNMARVWDILERHNACDDRDRLALKRDIRMLQQVAITAAGSLPGTSAGVLSPAEELPRLGGKVVDPEAPLTNVEFASCYLTPAQARAVTKDDVAIGKAVHALYRQRHGVDNKSTTNHLTAKHQKARQRLRLSMFGMAKNGVTCTPKIYSPQDWDLILDVLRGRGIVGVEEAAVLKAELKQFRFGLD